MKYLILTLFLLGGTVAYSQKYYKSPTPVKLDSPRTYTMIVTESDLVNFSMLFGYAMTSPGLTNSPYVTTAQFENVYKYSDSCRKAWGTIYNNWHPVDTTRKVNDTTRKTKP